MFCKKTLLQYIDKQLVGVVFFIVKILYISEWLYCFTKA